MNAQTLYQKVSRELDVPTFQTDHIPPSEYFNQLRKRLQGKNSLIDAYLQMRSTDSAQYFPTHQIGHETINTINDIPFLSARVILFAIFYYPQSPKSKLSKLVSNENQIYKKYLKLNGQYQNRYLCDIGMVRENKYDQRYQNDLQLPNYNFYAGKGIQKLHLEYRNYDFLEDRHDYIQWMFPNHYRSMFNSSSQPMSYLQVLYFQKSRKLGLLLLKSALIFFDFLGVQLTPDCTFTVISPERLRLSLIVNCHNHLRIRRLLACLSITGFRTIALRFISYLQQLINNQRAFFKLKRAFASQWRIYGQSDKARAIQLCFHPQQIFPPTHSICPNIFNQFHLNTPNYIQYQKQNEIKKQKQKQQEQNQKQNKEQETVFQFKNGYSNIEQIKMKQNKLNSQLSNNTKNNKQKQEVSLQQKQQLKQQKQQQKQQKQQQKQQKQQKQPKQQQNNCKNNRQQINQNQIKRQNDDKKKQQQQDKAQTLCQPCQLI